MVAAHIRAVGAQRMGDIKEMCACQTIVVQYPNINVLICACVVGGCSVFHLTLIWEPRSFLRALQAQKEENWYDTCIYTTEPYQSTLLQGPTRS